MTCLYIESLGVLQDFPKVKLIKIYFTNIFIFKLGRFHITFRDLLKALITVYVLLYFISYHEILVIAVLLLLIFTIYALRMFIIDSLVLYTAIYFLLILAADSVILVSGGFSRFYILDIRIVYFRIGSFHHLLLI